MLKNKLLVKGAIGIAVVVALGYFFVNYLVVANVNGLTITRIELWKELENVAGQQTLDQMITVKLIERKIAEYDVTASQEEIDALYSEFETVLAAQGMTLEQVLELQGQTVEEFNRNLVLQIKLNKIVEAETDLTVTDEEIQDYIANSGGEEVDFTEEDIDQLKVAISDQKLQQAVQDWISSLEEDAEITQYINF